MTRSSWRFGALVLLAPPLLRAAGAAGWPWVWTLASLWVPALPVVLLWTLGVVAVTFGGPPADRDGDQ